MQSRLLERKGIFLSAARRSLQRHRICSAARRQNLSHNVTQVQDHKNTKPDRTADQLPRSCSSIDWISPRSDKLESSARLKCSLGSDLARSLVASSAQLRDNAVSLGTGQDGFRQVRQARTDSRNSVRVFANRRGTNEGDKKTK